MMIINQKKKVKKIKKPYHPRHGCAILFKKINFRGKWAKLCGSSRNLAVRKRIKNQVRSIALGPRTHISVWKKNQIQGKTKNI